MDDSETSETFGRGALITTPLRIPPRTGHACQKVRHRESCSGESVMFDILTFLRKKNPQGTL